MQAWLFSSLPAEIKRKHRNLLLQIVDFVDPGKAGPSPDISVPEPKINATTSSEGINGYVPIKDFPEPYVSTTLNGSDLCIYVNQVQAEQLNGGKYLRYGAGR